MSGVKLEGNALGTGTFTIKSPNSNTDRTFDLPDSSGKLVAPASEGTVGQVLTSNGAGVGPSYQSLPAGGVTSLNGQTGAIVDTNLYAIGSYITGRAANYTSYAIDSTIAGSSLYTVATTSWYFNGGFKLASTNTATSSSLINTGTWRCVSAAWGDGASYGSLGLYVRIS